MHVAVIIPCYNEEPTVATVVTDARKYLPDAEIFVFDNNSKDATAIRAKAAGALVIPSRRQGKGHVVRHALRTISADVYLILDGDGTYSLAHAPALIEAVASGGYEMAVGTRLQNFREKSFRPLHLAGNKMFSLLVRFLFGQKITDIFSGYRAVSRHLVRRIPLRSEGFEIETEFTLQTFASGLPWIEIPTPYGERPAGSHSKLRTWGDGFLILKFIAHLVRHYKPLMFFSTFGFSFFIAGAVAGWAPIMDYVEHKFVYHVPLAILAASLMVMSAVFFGVGMILDAQIRYMHTQLDVFTSLLRDESLSEKDSSRKAG
jgi:glycosyltransferase involved in cell wall biosynthesis